MSAEVKDLPLLVSEMPLTPRDRFDAGLDSFLETTRQAFLEQLQILTLDAIPFHPVDVIRRGERVRESHPIVKIPGRLEPGESAYLTVEGDLYAVKESPIPGALDADSARPLLPSEMIDFAPSVFHHIGKLIQNAQNKSSQ